MLPFDLHGVLFNGSMDQLNDAITNMSISIDSMDQYLKPEKSALAAPCVEGKSSLEYSFVLVVSTQVNGHWQRLSRFSKFKAQNKPRHLETERQFPNGVLSMFL